MQKTISSLSALFAEAVADRLSFARWPLRTVAVLVLFFAAPTVVAQPYSTPPRGSETRVDILDAIRPRAEWSFGPPVEFVVDEMRVAGKVAFVTVRAQRPGGAGIDIWTVPDVLRGQLDPQAGNGPTMEVLLRKSGRVWVGVHYGLNSSEGWWYDPVYCPIWSAVLPEVCR